MQSDLLAQPLQGKDERMRELGGVFAKARVTALVVLTVVATGPAGCGSACDTASPHGPVVGLSLSVTTANLHVGNTTAALAHALGCGDRSLMIENTPAWSSSNMTVATVSIGSAIQANGVSPGAVILAKGAGVVTISVTYQSHTAAQTITVVP